MGRRGPDHAAHRQWRRDVGRNIYLLHSRLNIIDLDDRANQPFGVGSKWMVYNGELYNYLELRSQLKERGRGFITESDTEVLLHTLDHHGWPGLDDCEGMWAFAVYDEDDGSLTLCRDRFGEKPLYLYRDGSGLYFGSEVKFIVSLLGRRLEVNFEHLYRYMVNGYKALYKGDQTFFLGLTELPPASILSLVGEAESSLSVQRLITKAEAPAATNGRRRPTSSSAPPMALQAVSQPLRTTSGAFRRSLYRSRTVIQPSASLRPDDSGASGEKRA